MRVSQHFRQNVMNFRSANTESFHFKETMSEEPQVRVVIHPEPTESEKQAIIVAMDELWPIEPPKELPTSWRFSGRRWTKKIDLETEKKRWR